MLHAYIDESGDRGLTAKATDHFVLGATVVRDTRLPFVHDLLEGLRDDLRKPSGNYLTWKNIRAHSDRLRIAQVIGAQKWLRLVNVIACKRHLPPASLNQSQVYLYQLRFMLERLSWLARDTGETLQFTVAQIPNVKLTDLREYESILKRLPGCQIHWAALDPAGGSIDQPQRLEALQLADLATSASAAAFHPDRWGNSETRYLEIMSPRLYRRGNSPLTSYGLKMHPWSDSTKAAYPWIAAL